MNLLLPPALCLLALTGLRADVTISEFLADNVNGIKDENDSRQDWIELHNPGAAAVDLDGWWLTDNLGQPAKWRFPNVSIPAGGTLLVWASGKDRRVAGQPLHTNFSLAKSGEYLGLYKPAAGTGLPELVDHFAPAFPAQAPDISYGVSISQTTATLVASNAAGRYKVLADDTTGAANYTGNNYGAGDVGTGLAGGWNVSPGFVDSSWLACTTGLGYDTGSGLDPWIVTDCEVGFRNVNTSLLFRHTFSVPDPGVYTAFKLRMKYEDGFVAYLNGTEIGRANFSGTPTYNSKSDAALNETIVNSWTEFTIPPSAFLTNNNVLAIQGLNSSPGSSDFLLLPEIIATTGLVAGNRAYFSTPTPGSLNGSGTSGPVVFGASPVDPLVPRPDGTASSPPLAVSVNVIQTQHPVSAVQVIPRVMFNPELAAITMLDNGVAPDLVAGDMVFSANIPTNMLTYGQMLRWRFEVQDNAGNTSKLPAYLSTTDSPQYFGTVAQRNDLAHTQLPVMDWFVEGAPATGPTAAAFRGCMYFLGYFYDNIGHEIHGQSTAGMPKKSYDFDSNTGYRFLWQADEGRVKDLNIMSNYADKTKTRNTLTHEVASLMGAPYHFCKPIRMHLNAGFHGVMDMMEDGDDRMLERNGLDPEGAFYKIYNETMNVSAEKKTRKTEPNTDLNSLTTSLDPALPLATRRTYAYDNINIPAAINYLVTRQLNSDADHGHKNYYLYRDTNGSGEWTPIIWDVDLSQGHQWNGNTGTGGYFNDSLITNNPLNRHSANNRLYNVLLESPEFQQMFARRMRTAMDTILQAPGIYNGYLETRMRAIAASVDPDPANPSPLTDGDLDRAKWGMNAAFIDNRPREEVERVVAGYFGPRRTFLFDQSASRPLVQKPGLGGGTPLPNSPQAAGPDSVRIDAVDFLPPGTTQDAEYIILKNTTSGAVDISGWTLDGAVEHKFIGGTVIPAGAGNAAAEYKGLLHVVKNSAAFRSRPSGPSGGQNRLVQGNYSGQLSARGETVNLRDPSGQLISSLTYTGSPTPLQQYLRISEIQYHPANPTPAEALAIPGVSDNDFEYLELVNTGPTTLDLTNAAFVEGIAFTFPSASLAAGARLIVAKNPAAFALRYPASGVAVLGPYEGDLNNAGERLELTDAVGENILDFTYKDGWYPATDGSGHSLVLRDPGGTPHDDFGNPVAWAISDGAMGSPGSADTAFAQAYHGWDNFHFTSLERDDPLISGPDADPDGDGRNNADEYALGTHPRVADLPVLEFTWSMDGDTRRPALRFRRPANALDVTYELLAGGTLNDWPVVSTTTASSSPLPGNVEEVILRDAADDSSPGRFLRLRYTVSP
jgi:hypothetical protein